MNTKQLTLSGALSLCLLGMLTIGCEKATQQEQDPTPLPYVANAQYRLRSFNGVDWCNNWMGNCLPDVIVVGHVDHRAALNNHFQNMTGNLEAVKAFFTGSEWQEYFPSLALEESASFLQRLRSGECDIKRIESDTREFYYAGAGDLTPSVNEMVLPVVYE